MFMYQINSELFIALYCENKGRIDLKCNGACQLYKLAGDEEKKEINKILKQVCFEQVLNDNKENYFLVPLISYFSDKVPQNGLWCHNYIFSWQYHLIQPPDFI